MEYSGFFELSIEQILDKYLEGTLTATDVAQICIKSVKRKEPEALAWVSFNPEKLLEEAQAIDQRLNNHETLRQLEGIPIGVKDLFNTVDFTTEMGSPIWKNFTPGNDARVVFYLKKEGALIPGKTVTAEFGVHTLGKTLNPHDRTRTPGTSSSGSAVAVATGMIPAAIGTQTAGSIVRPASFCGIYGCKPSFGLIPRTGMLKTTDSLDTIGFFVLHYNDMKRLFDVLRVHGNNYPISNTALNDYKRQNKPSNRPWRVAFVKTHTWDYAPEYAQNALTDWSNKLSAVEDILVEEVSIPSIMDESHTVHSIIYDKTLSYYFKDEFKLETLISPIMKEMISNGNSISINQYQNALITQEKMARTMDEFFYNFDIVISLSTAGEAPLRNEIERPDSALMWTMTHLPVISAPVFISPRDLPFGVQIVARRYNDGLMFKFCDYLREMELIPAISNPSLVNK
jgi:Asp-tRNA(Asn)/Glu-tRNA(Gln) amidotransferase A subunit family amidase